MKRKSFVVVILSFVAIFVNLLSCQIGLGSSVDTESPTIAIEYPAAASCIKGEFVLAGSCSDDKGVTAVSVSITNSETAKTYGPYEATVNSKKTSWSVNLNKASTDSSAVNGWSFPDGKYEVSVVASDQAGHSSGQTSRAFEIDNSAPVFVIKSPGITDIENPTEYGSEFKIEGTISDDHSVSTMKVSVFNKDGNEITGSPFTESDIETAGGTSVTIAKNISGGTG